MDSSTILVTGAHGFIGRHTARHFARHGHTVIGMGHGGWKPDEWQSWGLSRWLESDISTAALELFALDSQAIIHCAGGSSVAHSISHPHQDFQRSVATTANVLEFVRLQSRSIRIVYLSSAAVYGIAAAPRISESSRCAPVSPYGVHKRLAEQLVTSYCQQYQIAASELRFFSVYGCGLRKQLLWDACRKLANGDRIFGGTGNEVRDWLHVEDAAELVRVAVSQASPLCPIANGGTGEGVTVRELLAHLAKHLLADGAQPMFSDIRRAGDPSRYVADNERAASWGWRPGAHWRERVAEYVAWWQLEMGLDKVGSHA